jgi:hypothetical protein
MVRGPIDIDAQHISGYPKVSALVVVWVRVSIKIEALLPREMIREMVAVQLPNVPRNTRAYE